MTKIIYLKFNYKDNFTNDERNEHLNSFLDELDDLGAKYSLSKGMNFISGDVRNIHRKNKGEIEEVLNKYLINDNRVVNGEFNY